MQSGESSVGATTNHGAETQRCYLGTFVFRSRGNTDRLHDVVKFNWEMAPRDGGEVAGVGLEILMLGPDGRIVSDYQFIEG